MSLHLNELIDKALEKEPDIDSVTLADKIFAKLTDDDLFDAVASYVVTRRRHRVHLLEREVGGWSKPKVVPPAKGGKAPAPPARDPYELHYKLLGEPVSVPKHGRIPWGEMTVEHHRLRLEMMKRRVDGHLETIRMHESAISLIEANKAECLNDIYVQPQAAGSNP